jgi:hypothetical protein
VVVVTIKALFDLTHSLDFLFCEMGPDLEGKEDDASQSSQYAVHKKCVYYSPGLHFFNYMRFTCFLSKTMR